MGTLCYLLFTHVPVLVPVGDAVGPVLVHIMPIVIFLILYVTFVKIEMKEFRPHTWHFAIQVIRTVLSAATVLAITLVHDAEWHLILTGMFVCFICPTAAAAAVVADKLGGSIASMTVFILIANCFTSVIIPLFFPMVERSADVTFVAAAMMVLRRVVSVLVIPLILAWITRRFLPALARRIRRSNNLGYYMWSFNLSIVMGMTVQKITHAPVSGLTLVMLCLLPLFICLFQFAVGKAVGGYYGDSITAGQALGQKNTVVGIWLTITFLNPYAAIAPCAYVIWQNLVNAIQIYIKEKKGRLTW